MKNKMFFGRIANLRPWGLRVMLVFFILQSSFYVHAQSDSLRVTPQRTAPETVEDLDTAAISLRLPDNLQQVTELDSLSGNYRIGTKLGKGGFLNIPIWMTPTEYQQWSLTRSMRGFFRQKNLSTSLMVKKSPSTIVRTNERNTVMLPRSLVMTYT